MPITFTNPSDGFPRDITVPDDGVPPVFPGQNQTTDTTNPADAIAKSYFGKDVPNKRQSNPLSNFASVNYQATLYLLSPGAYSGFVQSGRQNLDAFNRANFLGQNVSQPGATGNQGIFVIAQTGGINNQTQQRSDGFDLDFYIDNIIINTLQPGPGTESVAATYRIQMKIIEPYGFSLVTSLKRATAQAKLAEGVDGPNNPTQWFYVLGIRFLGYDINGKLLTGHENFNGGTLDPSAPDYNTGGVFDRYLDFTITDFRFNLDGKATVYNIDGTATGSDAFKTKRGIIDSQITIQADNVYNIIKGNNGLEKALNDIQESLYSKGDITQKTNYTFSFTPDSEEIAKAGLVDPQESNKYLFNKNGTPITASGQSDERTGFSASVVPTVKKLTFAAGTRILEILELVIKTSEYMNKALKVLHDNSPEPDPFTGEWNQLQQGNNVTISWFSVFAELTNPRYCTKQNDWIFDIEYKIQKYDTPYVLSPYANPGANYYGPHKIYKYWFTGKNTEVINFEQQFHNNYFLEVLVAPDANNNTRLKVTTMKSDGTNNSTLGPRSNAVNSYVTSLVDPASNASGKLTIMGDPDYLGTPWSSSINDLFNKFYGSDGFTISGSGGQVFVEIDFKEARDYNDKENNINDGLLNINDKISFYSNPWNLSGIDKFIGGLTYQVVEVEHRFVNGKFTQVLSLIYADPSRMNLGSIVDDARTPDQSADQATGGTTPAADGSANPGQGERPAEVPTTVGGYPVPTAFNGTNMVQSPNSPITPGQNGRYNPETGNFIVDDDNLGSNGYNNTYANDYNNGRIDTTGFGIPV